ncbi:MAG: TonB family protein [Alistipes sp.]|jgi:TonB family protein|nr:TonB family protein [Alistipes sp.]
MNYYDEEEEKKDKRWAILAVLFYLFLCGGGFLMKHTIDLPQSLLGIVIDFGSTNYGFGDTDLAVGKDDTSPLAPPPTPTPDDPLLTDSNTPVPVQETRPDVANARVDADAQPRRVDERTLFPGNAAASNSSSQGHPPTSELGNRGSLDGVPSDADTETDLSQLTVSSGVDLKGRYLIGALPRPAYEVEVEGRVVIAITVNSDGIVTGAEYEQAGSTTNHGTLVSAARAAAMRARFTQADADLQAGTITYTFRLN